MRPANRDFRYITQKVTYGAACAKCGITDSLDVNEEGESVVKGGKLAVGNLAAARDWGFAGNFVRAMWLMLQPARSDDFISGIGILRTVSQLCERVKRTC
jgi:GDPmannose 4,6-dehydratase